jgi:NAD(P)H-dependent flavin oxidoreductase YrpB (nitropropane dioxygenase family)
LIPKVVDICKGRKSPLTGKDIIVVAAGGIGDGRGLAMSLALGASGVWVGTRFVNAKEAGASPRHQQHVIRATHHDTVRTVI